MSIRGLLFLLFLYVVLVWLVVYYASPGAGLDEIVRQGVFWSAIGIGALMVWLIGERVFAWWRSRTTRPAKPAIQQVSPASPIHEDDLAFARLIAEADASLSQAPGIGRRAIRDFPICLLIGAEGAGKTCLIQNSGIDSRLLAGQVAGSGAQVTSTRVANIWLANETVFVEIGGRILQSEPSRFAEFLRVLGPPRQTSRWRRWLQDMQGGFRMPALRGVILCRDLRTCAAIPKNPLPTQDGQTIRDRIFAIANVFGIRCPVYTVFTRADAIPYFEEFFARFPVRDEGHIWGTLAKPEETAGPPEAGVWAEVETKRLNREFGSLFSRLNERRLLALNAEQVADRKPAIYEFPREFKRIRGALVQFLVDAMRPDPVALSPLPRGFFFTGVRRVERQAGDRPETGPRTDATIIGAADPTVIFRPDATQFLNAPLQGRGNLVDHWMFARDIFLQVLEKDRLMAQVTGAPHVRERRLPVLAWGAVGLASLMTLIWAVSWNENRELINRVTETTEAFGGGGPGFRSLRALDNLRDLLQNQLDQSGRWRMHWGLYVGDKLRERARTLYFDRLRHMFLAQANIRLGEQLYHVETSRSNDSVYDWLKTYITTTSASCPVDPPAVKKTLLEVIAEDHPDLDESSKVLVARQIDYYASVLPQGLPVSLPANPDSIERSREYIRNQHGPRQVYEKLINEVKKGSVPLSLRDEIGEYESVLDAPKEIPFEFSIKGRDKFEQLAGSDKLPRGDTCVLGSSEGVKTVVADSDQIRQARAIYYQYYRDDWKAFLAGTKVKPFRLEEAAKRLDKLSDPTTSPLLGLVRFVSRNTYSAPPKQGDSGLLDPVLPASIKQKRDQAAAKIAEANRPEFGPLEVSQIFQPAQWVVPPDSSSIHSEKNKPYVDALRNLGENTDVFVKASPSDQPQKFAALQEAVKQSKGAQRSLADGFNNNTEGVDTQLAGILLQPIQFVADGLPPRMVDPLEKNASADLKKLCGQISPLLNEYPFSQSGKDAGLTDVQNAFSPKSGTVWRFQQALADVVIKGTDGWVQGANQKVRASSDLLKFLNGAQKISDALFSGGYLGLGYSLRPVNQVPGRTIKLTIDGTTLDSTSSLEKPFIWPGAAGHEGAEGQILYASVGSSGFGDYPGTWGVFHLFKDAEPREPFWKTVAWSKIQSPGGRTQEFNPPVKVEITGFPAGGDVLNPRFFVPALGCPGRAVEPQ